ncbi:NAD(P)H-dependent oxidoreductase [Haloglycomyces albus]|uniref:NAD(P)H-dependent oxidoreductase n=1 Tax=Haloglycomyces albus TaxID=526067 RepID=UPI00046D7E1F|nr:NAD(P)H-dependent oxidoreductase [Haloglycomyces albus]
MSHKGNALVVHPHHRDDSFTATLARLAEKNLIEAGWSVDYLDLAAEGFDPNMNLADQPDWFDRDKEYSPEATAHMDRLLAADLVVIAFPVYWFSFPALLKGWIDRVWNYGFAYGRSRPRLADTRALFIATAGATADEEGTDEILLPSLNAQVYGTGHVCGLKETRLHLVFNAEGEGVDDRDAHYAELQAQVEKQVSELAAAGER